MSAAAGDSDEELGSWISIFVVDDGPIHSVEADQFDLIDSALGQWVERRIDKLLHLVNVNGSDVLIAASRISEVIVSTPASRAKQRRLEELSKAEQGYQSE